MPAPHLARRPHARVVHGVRFDDPYQWLRDAEDPQVREHLEAENAYTDEQTEHLEGLRRRIFDEISARTVQTDRSVPDYDVDSTGRAWWYYTRTEEGKSYPRFCRAPAPSPDDVPDASASLPGEVCLLDLEVEATGHAFYAVGDFTVSPDGNTVMWTQDTVGDELYTVRFRDAAARADLPDVIEEVGGACWIDDAHVGYLVCDEAWRPYLLRRRRLGTSPADDVDVYAETDERFWLGADRSADDHWVLIASVSKTSTEFRLLSVDDPTGVPHVVALREPGLEYDVEPAGDRLLILHNADCPDFAVAETSLAATDRSAWRTVLPGVQGVRLTGLDAYATHVVVSRRTDGMPSVLVCPRSSDGSLLPGRAVPRTHELETLASDASIYCSDRLRLVSESFVTPVEVTECAWAGDDPRVLKRQRVLPDPDGRPFDPAEYRQFRTHATALDGTSIPVSVVTRIDVTYPAPTLLYAYGAYETSLDPAFSIPRLSLLDRGVVVAYAHVRGGGELGRTWYEQGRLAAKPTTFTDLISCAQHLVDSRITDPSRLAARGFSAGGLTIGAAVNLAPHLFHAVHVGVGFVDPLTSMLDEDLPLTITEREEWGDPLHDQDAYRTMASYAPYENVTPGHYPAVLATAALQDQRVSFAEPAKWVAALRDAGHGDERPVLLRTELAGGHGGASGRYAAWNDEAFELAWLLDQLEATEVRPESDAPGSG